MRKRYCLFSRQVWRLVVLIASVILVSSSLSAQEKSSEKGSRNTGPNSQALGSVYAVRTESPRDTLMSFDRLREEFEETYALYLVHKTRANHKRLVRIAQNFGSLIDFSSVPLADRSNVALATAGYLLDILGRVGLPDLDKVPGESAFSQTGSAYYRIPETPLRIVRIEDGDRSGEFLFGEHTIRVAPQFYLAIEDEPLQSGLDIKSWSLTIPQISGPLIPSSFVMALPDSLKNLWLDTPLWKAIAIAMLLIPVAFLLAQIHRWISRNQPEGRLASIAFRLILPIAILALILIFLPFITLQLTLAGRLSQIVSSMSLLVFYLSGAWLLWLSTRLFFEWLILAPRINDQSLDANFSRLIGNIVGTIGVIIILALYGQAIGLPIMSMIAGLGIGGLAVALAIRPTLENLIGGFVLYFDQPIRVGDFCSFGDQSGTVETIGVRSTQIRALDRTLISVPNSQFADLQLTNWARCDQMMISHIVGLRYETDEDQLRYVLAKIREMFHSHPRIDSDTIRVRFAAYGACSLDINIRVYAKTREWNDFYAIQEDVLLRIYTIVKQSGTGFAFPSQTLYMAKDEGLDTELGEKANQAVAMWRRTRQLPFPRFADSKLERLQGKLRYPPPGSPDYNATDEELAEGGEQLSSEPLEEESNEVEDEQKTPEEAGDDDGGSTKRPD